MDNKVFREKNLERISSPEQLTDYIKVSNPSAWIVLGAVVVLLISVLIWSVFGTIPTTLTVMASVKDGISVGYVDSNSAAKIKSGMTVKIGDATGTVSEVSTIPVSLTVLIDEYGDTDAVKALSAGTMNYPVRATISGVADGLYEMVITLDEVKPISFVVN
ncbi:hypothetical protein [Acetobacterium woodii]|nr:hypothetical protein [Acetobacterium woodii]